MQAHELRALTPEELRQKTRELEDNIFRLRLRRGSGQLENPMSLRNARRDLARALTVERAMRAEGVGS